MNIKSLIAGSLAIFAAIPSAQAADGIVAADPEGSDYVRVCDAYGTGYFYIPGSETCLKIGGYLRFDWNYGFGEGFEDRFVWNERNRAVVQIATKRDTEYGPLSTMFVMQGNIRYKVEGIDGATLGGNQSTIYMDQGYIDIAGWRVGKFLNWWDDDFSSEFDVTNSGDTTFNAIRYQYENDDFYAGLAVEDLTYTDKEDKIIKDAGLDVAIGDKTDLFSYEVLAGFDSDAGDGSVRLKLEKDIGPGTFGIAGIYSSGPNAYFKRGEWVLAAQYAAKVNDKLSVTPGVQYTDKIDLDARGNYASGSEVRAGVTVDYKILKNLTTKFVLNYISRQHDGSEDVDYNQGFIRIQRSF